MYSMKNGILYENGKAVFCVGQSYYPSYHPYKVPVPEDGDRVGEMKKDILGMKEAGFNLVRGASIGDVRRVNGEIEIHTEFMEQMLDECDKVGIASMMRLQGYSMNLSGYDDFYMINAEGQEMDKTRWYDFLQNSMYHEGILRDNDEGTKALAQLYAKHPSLVSFQTYNEPHYPSSGLFDYHPATIAAYRKWVVEKGIMTEAEAADYDPPRRRPGKGEDIQPWVNWRLFSVETLSKFLAHSADVAKKVDPTKESLTCITVDPVRVDNARRGCSYFDNAKDMDTLGITHYIASYGAPYFEACLVLDNSESAAAAQGKHCWLIEYDARTNITLKKLYQETYAAVGAGIKGIMYYQWRGDHIFPDSPEGNGFGFLNYDGTKTENYEKKLDVVRLLNKLSDEIGNAERMRCGIAVVHSEHAFMAADALENDEISERNSFLELYKALYKQLRMTGITVDFTQTDMLSSNPLGLKAVLVPRYSLFSQKEKDELQAFQDKGGKVYICEDATFAMKRLGETYGKYEETPHNIEDILDENDIEPIIISSNRSLMVQAIKGDGYAVACLNNISTVNETLTGATLTLNQLTATKATLYTPYSEAELRVEGDVVYLPEIKEGAFVVLR